MQNLGLFRYLQPSFFSGLFDDPVLFIHVRPTGRGILLDCGQLHHLAKRVLRAVDAVFISHAHMDHLIGFDHLLRHVHVAPRTIEFYGPAGIAERIGHKLSGYDWNLTEKHWCTIQVFEVHPNRIKKFEFAGANGFGKLHCKTIERQCRVIYRSRHLTVEAEICDHKIPVLAFRVTEKESFLLDREKLVAEQLQPGPWLKELKRRFHAMAWGDAPITVRGKTAAGHHELEITDVGRLYERIRRSCSPASIGYLSDVGMSEENFERISGLLNRVSLLLSECTFLKGDEEKARRSAHLCTLDLNRISRQLKPDYLLPMHLSKSYIGDPHALYQELIPPKETRILQLPDYVTPRPLLPRELPALGGEEPDKS